MQLSLDNFISQIYWSKRISLSTNATVKKLVSIFRKEMDGKKKNSEDRKIERRITG